MEIVCQQWTEDFKVKGYAIKDILSLIKEAYGERAKQGIVFETLNYQVEDLIAERTDADYWILAFEDNGQLDGTARLTVKDNWGEICNFAVSPSCQGKHIGAQLLQKANQFAKHLKLDYVKSYTAMKATSSVKCHVHNGYDIVGILSYLDKDYSSYVFRCQLSPVHRFSYQWMRYSQYIKAYIMYKMKKRQNGQNTWLGDVMLSIKKRKESWKS
jgi:N-acetylglutamate synthase-like GNAT family acetyltransferase